MTRSARLTALRYSMIGTGVLFVFGLRTLTWVWPSGWSWGSGHSHYLAMILGVYATLGVFLIRGARDPLANMSLVWFTVWSNVVHAVVMAGSALTDRAETGHLAGDVPALLVLAAALGVAAWRAESETTVTRLEARRAA